MKTSLGWLSCLLLLMPAIASASAAGNANEIDALVARIEDPAKREQLVNDLQALNEVASDSDEAANALPAIDDLWAQTTDATEGLIANLQTIEPVRLTTLIGFSLGLILLALVVRYGLTRGARRLILKVGEDTGAKRPPISSTLLQHVFDAALAIALLLGLAEIWGADPRSLLQTDAGTAAADTLFSLLLILMLALAASSLLRGVVRQTVRRRHPGDSSSRQQQRLETLEPLMLNVLNVTIALFALLLVLSELGINVGPLLAGAGVVGIAIGFGAQTLVKDLITGVTLLFEDACSVGDVIETGGHFGRIEMMRLRFMQLRDLGSVVHVLPYSEVTTIKNYTKDYAHYVFDIGVAYKEDVGEVIDILTELGEEFREESDFESSILEPLEILGVDQFKDSAVNIRARFKTRPHDRWNVGWTFNQRIKRRFDERGIEIPFPHTTLYMGEPKEGDAAPLPVMLTGEEAEAGKT